MTLKHVSKTVCFSMSERCLLENATNKGNIPTANDEAAKRAAMTTKVMSPDMLTTTLLDV